MAPWLTELPQQSTLTTEAAEDRWAQIREGGKEKRRKSSQKYSAKYLGEIFGKWGRLLQPCSLSQAALPWSVHAAHSPKLILSFGVALPGTSLAFNFARHPAK